ncbi:MAG: LCP family protein [Sarcina sp.]
MSDLNNTQSFPKGFTENNNKNDDDNNDNKPPKKNNTKWKVLIVFLIVIAIIILGVIGSGYYYVTHTLNHLDRVQVNQNDIGINSSTDAQLSQFKGITNIAIFGVDEPKGTPGRSDTIMIATIDTNNNTLKLTSIMRDSYVNIPGYGMNKINAAYAFGGPQLALATINKDYDMNIRYYVTEDFTTLPKLVDILGGVTETLDAKMAQSVVGCAQGINPLLHENAPITINGPGTYNLNGVEALAYCRVRDGVGGDYARTYRQRQVMEQVYQKLKAQPVSSLPGIADQILPTLQTNLTNSQIMDLGYQILKMKVPSIQEGRIPLNSQSHGEMISGEWYLVFNQQEATNNLHNFIFENKPLANTEYDN